MEVKPYIMKKSASLRITADICFYFSVLSMFPAFRSFQLSFAVFTAAAFLATLLASRCGSTVLRLLLGILPGLAFLLAPLQPLLFFPVLAWFYLLLIFGLDRFHMWLDQYRQIYVMLLFICLFFIFANLTNYWLSHGNMISYAGIIYAALFLFLGMIAMREMQMSARMPLRWHLQNAAVVVGVPTLAAAISMGLFLLVRSSESLIRVIFKPLGLFLDWLLGLFTRDVTFDAAPTPMPESTPMPTPQIVDETNANGHGLYQLLDNDDKIYKVFVDKATSVAVYLAVFALVLLVLYLIYRYVVSQRTEELDDILYENGSDSPGRNKKRKVRKTHAVGKGNQIRQIYRRYLSLMRENGVTIQRDSTSEDVLAAADAVNESKAAVRLRELYLKARYDEEHKISREDVNEAQACLDEILRDEAWKK